MVHGLARSHERFACHFKACTSWGVFYLAVCQNQSELTIPSSVTPLSTLVCVCVLMCQWVGLCVSGSPETPWHPLRPWDPLLTGGFLECVSWLYCWLANISESCLSYCFPPSLPFLKWDFHTDELIHVHLNIKNIPHNPPYVSIWHTKYFYVIIESTHYQYTKR